MSSRIDLDQVREIAVVSVQKPVLDTELWPVGDPGNPTASMRAVVDDHVSHGAGGALVKLEHATPGPGGSMAYLSCDDRAVQEGRVAAAGGSIVRPKLSIGAPRLRQCRGRGPCCGFSAR